MTITPLSVIAVLVLGVLFFGKNLPGVARQVGSALMEFRKGLNEWKETHHRSSTSVGEVRSKVAVPQDEPEERFETLGAKFEPPSESA
jgi:Sec-independent protein translocase protein TatA